MKKIIIFIASYFLLPFVGGCQPLSDLKRDFSWNMGDEGYTQNALQNGYGLTNIDFNTTTPTITSRADSAGFWRTSSSICDSMGRLQFYTNGIFIYGADGHTLAGNDTLNPGFYTNDNISIGSGYPLHQGTLVLPLPNHNSLYYVLHQQLNDDYITWPVANNLYYTLVDMAENNGRGRVTSIRNVIIENDSMAYGKITACRHANGRDWWITCWAIDLYKYHKILLDPQGLHDYGWQSNQFVRFPNSAHGQCSFSPDGTKYANITNQLIMQSNGVQLIRGHVEVYDFNRCTGHFSNQQIIILQDTAHIMPHGLSFSPNSRYLYTSYLSFDYNVPMLTHQYDVWAGNIAATQVVIGVYDGFIDPDFYPYGKTAPNTHYLAKNGKIYIHGGVGTKFFNVIENPNIGGIGCNLQQHSVQLSLFKDVNANDHPNYRLGALVGSSCDTVYTTASNPLNPPKEDFLKVYPNPANEKVRLTWDLLMPDATVCTVANDIGRIVYRDPIAEYSMAKDIDTSRFPNGTYTITLQNKVLGVFSTIKLVVIH